MTWPTEKDLKKTYSDIRRHSIYAAQKAGIIPGMIKEGNMKFDAKDQPTIQTHDIAHELELHGIRRCNMVCLFVDMVGSTKRKLDHLDFWDIFVNQVFLNFLTQIATCDESKGKLAGYRGDGAFFVWFYKVSKTPDYADFDNVEKALQSALRCAGQMNETLSFLCDLLRNDTLARSVNEEVNSSISGKRSFSAMSTPSRYYDMKVRIGIDFGDLALTRVGLRLNASELTLIGKNADLASKYASDAKEGGIAISVEAEKVLPKVEGGTLIFLPSQGKDNRSFFTLDPKTSHSLIQKKYNIFLILLNR